MSSSPALEAFLAEPRNVIVAGIRKDGRPHLSRIGSSGTASTSTSPRPASAPSTTIFRRDPRAELVVDEPEGMRYVEIPTTVGIREDVPANVGLFRAIREKHGRQTPPDDELAAQLIADDRVLLVFTPSTPASAWTSMNIRSRPPDPSGWAADLADQCGDDQPGAGADLEDRAEDVAGHPAEPPPRRPLEQPAGERPASAAASPRAASAGPPAVRPAAATAQASAPTVSARSAAVVRPATSAPNPPGRAAGEEVATTTETRPVTSARTSAAAASGSRGIAATAVTWTSSTRTSAPTPIGPMSERRMMSSASAAGRRLPSPSAVSASPSRCRPPVSTAISRDRERRPEQPPGTGRVEPADGQHDAGPGAAEQQPDPGQPQDRAGGHVVVEHPADPGGDRGEQAQRDPPGGRLLALTARYRSRRAMPAVHSQTCSHSAAIRAFSLPSSSR